jgi:hypothetical protein
MVGGILVDVKKNSGFVLFTLLEVAHNEIRNPKYLHGDRIGCGGFRRNSIHSIFFGSLL